DRYSDLKLCFAHGGGYACFGAPRMNRGHLVRPESRLNTSKSPSDYLKSLYYDCLTHGYDELEFLVNKVGADRILMGSDFPFDMGLDSPPEWISQMPFLNDLSKEAILGGNAKRLLKI
nr:amidohydrolase [Dehalococcoidia bacterium]